MLYFTSVKRFLFIIVPVLIISVLSTSSVQAQVIFGVQTCEEVTLREEAPSSSIKARYARYLRRSGAPKTFRGQEELEYWCYLKTKREEEQAARLDRHDPQSRRDLDTRFYKPVDDPDFVPATQVKFDPTGAGSESLAPNREARIQQRVKNDNCQKDSIPDIEYDRCVWLLRKKDSEKEQFSEGKRLAGRKERAASRRQQRVQGRRLVPQDYTENSASEEISTLEDKEKVMEEFDATGPGSVPLDDAHEHDAKKYVSRGACLRAPQELRERCHFLVRELAFKRQQQAERTRSRSASRGIAAGQVIRRGVSSSYRRSISDTVSLDKQRKKAGFRPSPRTIREAEDLFGVIRGAGRRYRSTKILTGDCEKFGDCN
jgi:hypothetical protein